APCHVQRAELARAKRESPELYDWFGFMNARWELLDGDTEILPGLAVITTPGHTVGHQCVVVASDGQPDLLIGDAAYTPRQYAGPPDEDLPPGQASDPGAWRGSLGRIRSLEPARSGRGRRPGCTSATTPTSPTAADAVGDSRGPAARRRGPPAFDPDLAPGQTDGP